jgi:AraC-like DNA-binding protein
LIEKSRAKYIADPKMASDIEKTRSTLITTLDVFHNQGTHVKNEFAAEAGSAVRNILASIQLGKAAISAAFGDQATVRQVAQDIGMSQTATMTRILKSTLAAHKGRERNTQLSKMGVIMENAINLSVAQSRYAGEISGPFISQVIPDVVLRATGLSPITQAARSAFNFEFMAYFAESLGKNYDQLDVNFKRMLVRFGLDKDWSVLTQVKPYDWDGTKMLSFVEIDEANIPGVDLTDLSNRFLSMQRSLTDDAVIVSSLREQVATGAAIPRGSVAGEACKIHYVIQAFCNHCHDKASL